MAVMPVMVVPVVIHVGNEGVGWRHMNTGGRRGSDGTTRGQGGQAANRGGGEK
jgi:hypothetical protein